MEGHRLLLRQVPHHEPAQPFNLIRLQRLNPARVALREIGELEIGNDIPGVQILESIRPNQKRHIGELLNVVDVLQVLVKDYLARA